MASDPLEWAHDAAKIITACIGTPCRTIVGTDGAGAGYRCCDCTTGIGLLRVELTGIINHPVGNRPDPCGHRANGTYMARLRQCHTSWEIVAGTAVGPANVDQRNAEEQVMVRNGWAAWRALRCALQTGGPWYGSTVIVHRLTPVRDELCAGVDIEFTAPLSECCPC
jgi:hypothetical protein